MLLSCASAVERTWAMFTFACTGGRAACQGPMASQAVLLEANGSPGRSHVVLGH